ncbi:MAG: hypothetical protein J2P21_01940 [Chloracidobacterium sp.]|nr:hypothetical protein [Chloracidobacterium sp.]
MQGTTEHDERAIRYLLGDLTETEQMAVEQEYCADSEKFEVVWAAENDLVDRYARGRLPRGERELFERNYLLSPKHRDRVALARKLLVVADRQTAESSPAFDRPRGRLIDTLSALLTARILAPTIAFLLLLSALSWLLIERSRLNEELEKTLTLLSNQQRQEREVADQLAAEREQSGKLKSELDRALETIARKTPLTFLLTPAQTSRTEGGTLRQITIPSEANLVRLRMKIEDNSSGEFQAAIRKVGGQMVWTRRSIKTRSGEITVDVPASKLPTEDYFLTLSATTPTGETEVIKYSFRVIRK